MFRDEIPLLLRNYRVIQVGLTGMLSYLLYMWTIWLLETPYSDLTEWQVLPIATIPPALIAGLFKFLELTIRKDTNVPPKNDP